MKDKNGKLIRRGDVYWINFDPSIGSEIKKKRPAVIIQDHKIAGSSQTILVCPIISSANIHPFDVLLPTNFLEKNSRARCIQIKTCDLARFLDFCGHLDQTLMDEIFEKIFILLGF